MEQVYRIEIPVDAINATDAAALRALETALQRIFTSANKSKDAAQSAIDGINRGASSAASSVKNLDGALENTARSFEKTADSAEEVGDAGEQAANEAGAAAEKLGNDVEDVAESYQETGRSAKEAGSNTSSAFSQAGQSVDRFTQRTEKSQQSLRKMFAQKLQLTLAAIDKVSPTLRSIGSSLKNMTSKAWHVAVRIKDFVTAPFRKIVSMITSPIAMTLSLAGVGMGASSFLTTFTDFSAGMSNVKALSGATDLEFKQLTATAEQLGATTKFTAAEASEGMQYLAMAGWDTSQIIAAMPGLLDLAAAGATDLGTAADIVSDVMTAMGMSADQASTAADIFARTATKTNTTISGIGESLKYAAPIAHSFGLTLSEVSTMVGMMGNAGIKASQAGTAIRSSLLSMASPSKEAATLMKQLNLSFSNSDGTMRNMGAIIADLQTAFKGMTEQERLANSEILFGTMASSAWLGIIDQGADEYNRLFKAIDESAGAAKEMSEIQLDNLQGDMTKLQSAVDGMKISLMKDLDPYLRKGVQWLTAQVPALTDKISTLFTTGISKAKELKSFVQDVFNSSDFKNADGFAEKFFIAWDKIIAEPFSDWWEGNGQDMVLGVVEKAGSGLGQMYHGIISGIFAALKGEEIDFEGLNLTGLAKAGAQAAKTFIESFKDSLDLGGLFNDAPGLLKAGVVGFGAMKVGGGALSAVRTISQFKTAFLGVSTAAGAATTTTTAFGGAATATAAGAAKGATALTAVKTALAAIPVWGWVAAAALAAVTVAAVSYSSAQKQHERDLLNTGKAAASMAEEYSRSVDRISEATDTMETIKEIQLQIATDEGGDKQVIDSFNEQLQGIEDRTVYLTAKLAEEETLSKEEVLAYQSELDLLTGKTVELVASLNDDGYDAAQVAVIQSQVDSIVEGEKSVTVTIAKNTQLTPEEIASYVATLSALMATKSTYELLIQGAGLTPTEIAEYRIELQKIRTRQADINVKLNKGQGTMSDAEWNSLVSEAATLQAQAADIELVLQGSELNETEVNSLKTKLAEVRGEAAGILLNIGYSPDSDIDQEEMNSIVNTLANIGEVKAQLNISLTDGSMGVEELEALNAQLNEAYGNLVEMSGGRFTQADVERGRITQERYDAWVKDETVRAEAERLNFRAQVESDRANVDELVERRTAAQESARYVESITSGSVSDYDFMDSLDVQRQLLLGQYRTGQITEDQLFEGGQQILQQASEREWSQMSPANFSAMSVENLFGKYNGGFLGLQWQADESVNPFGDALSVLQEQISGTDTSTDAYNAQAAEYNSALLQQYQNEARVVELDSFAGFGVESTNSTATIQELAASYDTLDSAGREMFANAIAGLQELNNTTDYISDAEKLNISDLISDASQSVTISANVEVLGDVKSKLTELSTTYNTLSSDAAKADFNADNIEAVNAALESLGIDKINDLSELGAKLEEISAIDPSGLSFDAAAASLEALGGNADTVRANVAEAQAALDALNAKTVASATSSVQALGGTAESARQKVNSVGSALDGLDGKSVTSYINIVQRGSTSVVPHATGGIYGAPHVGLVAEDGPEAIIPLGSKRRDRGLDLWMQAGEMLGVRAFADGGIMAPYASAIADLPDFILNDEDDPTPISVPSSGGGGGTVIQVSVDSSPTFEIKGENYGDIIEALKGRMKELAELLGTEFAEQISDIILNIA